MIRRPPRSTHCISSAASDVYKRQGSRRVPAEGFKGLRAANNRLSKFQIKERRLSDGKGFPMAHTCFNTIELPHYETTEAMAEAVHSILNTPECFKFAIE
eukprot:TRINITY_DN7311_c0_g1_i7.p2 TRINITY_DN7311_c0_g1~~TRINITY_DN7311_c0_g1_i7.p2  ORF type:complete len:108 (+),score=44.36 TRINITY_DN7311_c0_g1_i7:26-325(+)